MGIEKIILYSLIGLFGFFAIMLMIGAKRNLARWKVSFIALSTFSWIISYEILKNATSVFIVAIVAKTLLLSASAIVYSMYFLSLEFIGKSSKSLEYRNFSVLIITFLTLVGFLINGVFLGEINAVGKSVLEKAPAGSFFFIVLLFWVYVIVNTIVNYIYAYLHSTSIVRTQIAYVVFGMLFFLVSSIITGALLPAMGNSSFVWLAPYGSIFFVSSISYAIFKYRLLDISIIIKRTTLYLFLTSILTGLYVFLLLLPLRIVPSGSSSVVLVVFAAVVSALTIQPLHNWLDNVTDRIFFQKKYDYYLLLEKVSRGLNSVFKLEEALGVVAHSLVHEMQMKSVAVFLREKVGSGIYACHKKEGEVSSMMPDQVDESNPVVEHLMEKREILESGEFRHRFGHLYQEGNILDLVKAEMQRFMDQEFGGGLIIPLVLKKTLIGFMVLGEKRSQDLFTHRDLALLETLSSQMATALENIQLYEQMLNNERLTIIGTMSAGIAHEIRNPLAAIKTFIQMLPDKYEHLEFRKRFNEIVPSEIERLSGITADLLAFSKPSSPSLESISLPQIIDRVFSLLNNQIRKKRMVIEKDLANVPAFQADPQQLFQVFLNIILNGIQASQAEGLIRIKAEIKEYLPSGTGKTGECILISITDQGMGIKRKDLTSIFQPFFTTKSEGTGLGLATCKRIAEAHRGEILVESEEGSGTMFTIVLPLSLTPEVIKGGQL
ncbi:GAF domain-containing protein [bacterium]|nr:GAF domain-containing protein [bacterium]